MPDSQDRVLGSGSIRSPSDPNNHDFYETDPNLTARPAINNILSGDEATQRGQQAPPSGVHNLLAAAPRVAQGFAPRIDTTGRQPVARNDPDESPGRPRRAAAELGGQRTAQILHHEDRPLSDVDETKSESEDAHSDDEGDGSPVEITAPSERPTHRPPHRGSRNDITFEFEGMEMTEDLRLKEGDKVTFKYAEEAGNPIAHVYIRKKRRTVVTPMGQGTAPVAVTDTPGANTSAAAAAVTAACCAGMAGPSGIARAGSKRNFHTMEQSDRRQVANPAPVAVAAAPVNAPPLAPTSSPTLAPAAPPALVPTATGSVFSGEISVGAHRLRRVEDIFQSHNVPHDTIVAIKNLFVKVTPEDRVAIFDGIISLAGNAEAVHNEAQLWAELYFKEMQRIK